MISTREGSGTLARTDCTCPKRVMMGALTMQVAMEMRTMVKKSLEGWLKEQAWALTSQLHICFMIERGKAYGRGFELSWSVCS